MPNYNEYTIYCEFCGLEVCSRSPRIRFCSRSCREAAGTANKRNAVRFSLGREQVIKYLKRLHDTKRRASPSQGDTKKLYISFEDLLELYDRQKGLCALSGLAMRAVVKRRHPLKISLDRVDNTKPYTKENTQLVCLICNVMKLDLSMADFKLYIAAIHSKLNGS